MSLTHSRIMAGVYHIGDGRGNYCTLLAGETGAVLYDTMMGFDDLRGYVAELTDHVPMVINSHCHFDHAGGNHQFDRVYMSEKDFHLMDETVEQMDVLSGTLNADLSRMRDSFACKERVSPIEGGTVLDLGGMTVEVIPLPGHTAGSIGLLCREHRLLLAGDGISPQMCIFFPESLPPEEYRATLESLDGLPFDRFLLAHFDILFEKSILSKFARCLDLIDNGRFFRYQFPALPDKRGRFFVLTPRDPETGLLIGIVAKEAE